RAHSRAPRARRGHALGAERACARARRDLVDSVGSHDATRAATAAAPGSDGHLPARLPRDHLDRASARGRDDPRAALPRSPPPGGGSLRRSSRRNRRRRRASPGSGAVSRPAAGFAIAIAAATAATGLAGIHRELWIWLTWLEAPAHLATGAMTT